MSQACRSCASNHLRCSEEKPCRRCVNKGFECDYDQSVQMALTPPETGRSVSMESISPEIIMQPPVVGGRYEQSLPSPETSMMTGKLELLPNTTTTET
ncbi:hypothetical protein IMZ48_38010 [Candidatus Bathyarchaeota archaeon]|nr:hypothetical protein [Candidatus Bathyarchaeota archaeon]